MGISRSPQQFSGKRGGIAEQRIEVGGGVEDEAVAAKGGAESAQHVVALQQQHFQAAARQQVGAEQPADPAADEDRVVVRGVSRPKMV